MDYSILVNKDNPLPRAHIPNNLIEAESEYKEGILIDKKVKEEFGVDLEAEVILLGK